MSSFSVTRYPFKVHPITRFCLTRPWIARWIVPFSHWYAGKMGHRQLGLKYEDLYPEESETMQLALKRLPPREAYDRVFRLRRAFQLSLSHQLLPEEEWVKPGEDIPYLSPLIDEIETEIKEREDLDSMVMEKKKSASKADEGEKSGH
ncbi:MAG: Cytochrome b-c1 complex subunit 7 [Alyxoria varia]|nr:MAG: Cytochrome b-c1 complex subunit 7 [Alyxoria varia]